MSQDTWIFRVKTLWNSHKQWHEIPPSLKVTMTGPSPVPNAIAHALLKTPESIEVQYVRKGWSANYVRKDPTARAILDYLNEVLSLKCERPGKIEEYADEIIKAIGPVTRSSP